MLSSARADRLMAAAIAAILLLTTGVSRAYCSNELDGRLVPERAAASSAVPFGRSPDGAGERVEVNYTPSGYPRFEDILNWESGDPLEVIDQRGDRFYFTLDSHLQAEAVSILKRNAVPWGAIVALDPRTGKVLALAGYSTRQPNGGNVALRASFPAASLFKLVTAAAAIERSGMGSGEMIRYRGSPYALGPYNYQPHPRDSKQMTFAEALGKSCNPVFSRIALKSLSESGLAQYAMNFGFNSPLPFEVPAEMSRFSDPSSEYTFARTAAGFGEVKLSPLHAAVMVGTIANEGRMMRPYVVDRVVDPYGRLKYQARPTLVKHSILPSTAKQLMQMMEYTVEVGTAKRQFLNLRTRLKTPVNIAAKTGTLSGDDPKGLYTWLVAALPAEKPELAIATMVIDPGNARVRGTALARQFLESYFEAEGELNPRRSAPKSVRVKSAKASGKKATVRAKKNRRTGVEVAERSRNRTLLRSRGLS